MPELPSGWELRTSRHDPSKTYYANERLRKTCWTIEDAVKLSAAESTGCKKGAGPGPAASVTRNRYWF